jgi:hypothetical protein
MAAPEPTAALALSPAQLQEVLQILGRLMPAVEVRVFGSRAKGMPSPYLTSPACRFGWMCWTGRPPRRRFSRR